MRIITGEPLARLIALKHTPFRTENLRTLFAHGQANSDLVRRGAACVSWHADQFGVTRKGERIIQASLQHTAAAMQEAAMVLQAVAGET